MNVEATDESKVRPVALHKPQQAAPAEPSSETAAIMQMIERVALDPTVDISRLERLLDMHERLITRNAKAAFDAALSEMQPELPIVQERGRIEVREKDAQGRRTGQVQQSTTFAKWEDINEVITPVLAKHGFALSFRTGLASDGRITVTGILSHRDGHREETMMTLPHDSTGSKNAVQAVGSSTSYGKRYTAIALLNIVSRGEDDDGNAAGGDGPVNDEQVEQLQALIVKVAADIPRFCKYFKIERIEELRAKDFDRAVDALKKKGAQQ